MGSATYSIRKERTTTKKALQEPALSLSLCGLSARKVPHSSSSQPLIAPGCATAIALLRNQPLLLTGLIFSLMTEESFWSHSPEKNNEDLCIMMIAE